MEGSDECNDLQLFLCKFIAFETLLEERVASIPAVAESQTMVSGIRGAADK